MEHLERDVLASGELTSIVDRIAAREVDPYTAANELLARAWASSCRRPSTSHECTSHEKDSCSSDVFVVFVSS